MSEPAPQTPGYGSPIQDDPLRTLALKRLKTKGEFRAHLVSYLIVNAGITGVWLVVAITTGAWFPWFLFPILGWGIGLAFHAWAAYGPVPSAPTEAQISQEMNRIQRGR